MRRRKSAKARCSVLYSLENHDFQYGDEYFSETAFTEYLPRLYEITSADSYQILEYDDLIIFTANDKNNQISKETLAGFKSILSKEKPVVLVLHVPLEPLIENTTLLEDTINVWGPSDKGNSRVIIGEHGCKPKKPTKEFIKLVTAEDSPVKLILGGHIHFYHKDYVTDNIPQLITGTAFQKNAVFVQLKP